ncbi:MAG TPA: hypothetical protein PKU78_00455 [Candidatus Dojkabacteria bacterium]|nr:hypothetical protein [Candidatus Dojkabacteria bacterium]HRO64676.1 hypothetical protein [Candidatus Dojkabacteria bacterium]HRP36542.1 hypothetical protein [Candidatus Dojkabacteria bacterium]HRP51022.1 hypothetical protein [Candidatus Dojkabacteria bacterium]
MDINDFAKLVLVLSLSFSLVGIAIQIMRLLGTTNETLKLSHDILKSLTKLGEKVTEDYSKFSTHLLTLSESVSRIGTDVIVPVVGLFSFLDRFKSSKK